MRGLSWFRGIRGMREMRSVRGLRAKWAEGLRKLIGLREL